MRPTQPVFALTAQLLGIISMIFASPSLFGESGEALAPTTQSAPVEGLLQSAASCIDCRWSAKGSRKKRLAFVASDSLVNDKDRVKTGFMAQGSFIKARKVPKRKLDELEKTAPELDHENLQYACPDLNLPPSDNGNRSESYELSEPGSCKDLLTMQSDANWPACQLPSSSKARTHGGNEYHWNANQFGSKRITEVVDKGFGNIQGRGVRINTLEIPTFKRRTIHNQHSQGSEEGSEILHSGLVNLDFDNSNIKHTLQQLAVNRPPFSLKLGLCPQRYEITPAVLRSIVLPFEEELKRVFCSLPSEKYVEKKYPFKDLKIFEALSVNKTGTKALSVIRLGCGATRLQSYATTQTRFKPLIRWLTYYHSILINHFGMPAKQADQSPKSFLDWMLQQAFRKGVPITGSVTLPIEFHDKRIFRPAQIHLIRYFTSERYLVKVQETALLVFAIWYKNQDPHRWKRIFVDDVGFWSLITPVIRANKSFTENSSTPGDQIESCILYRNRGISKFDIINFKPQPMFTSSNQILNFKLNDGADNPSEQRFLKNIEKIYHFKKTFHYHERIQLHRTSAVAIPLFSNAPAHSDIYTIRFSLAGKSKGIGGTLKKTSTLLSHMRKYHDKLLDGIKLKETKIKNHEFFLKWFWKVCFDPGSGGGLPIFGIVKGPIYPWQIPHFGPIQEHLIEHYSRHDSRNTMASTAISILRYWYKTENPKFWEDHFKSDDTFSDILWTFL